MQIDTEEQLEDRLSQPTLGDVEAIVRSYSITVASASRAGQESASSSAHLARPLLPVPRTAGSPGSPKPPVACQLPGLPRRLEGQLAWKLRL
jgi:hypothetical protein